MVNIEDEMVFQFQKKSHGISGSSFSVNSLCSLSFYYVIDKRFGVIYFNKCISDDFNFFIKVISYSFCTMQISCYAVSLLSFEDV